MQPTKQKITVKTFICYTHADQELRQKLEEHLSSLKYSGQINVWQDQEILPGDNWDDQIKIRLEEADMILLLVSARFLASQYCWENEVQKALERHNAGTARVIPIILQPTLWRDSPLGQLQALPTGTQPVTQWANQEAAFVNVALGIQKAAEDLQIVLRKREIELQKAIQIKQEILEVTKNIEEVVMPMYTLLDKEQTDIDNTILQKENRRKDLENTKKELEAQIEEINTSIKETNTSLKDLRIKQKTSKDKLLQLTQQLWEAYEQLINLGIQPFDLPGKGFILYQKLSRTRWWRKR